MKRFLAIFIGFPLWAVAQQLPTQSLNQYDMSLINPGYSVSIKAPQINIHHRSQWVGFDEAPNTQTLTFVKRIEDKNLGYGIYVFNDRYGPFQRIGLNLSGSYDVQVSENIKVGLGLSAALQQFNVNKDKIDLYHTDDEVVNNSVNGSVWTPDFAFGAYAYHDKFYLGFSVLHLVTNDVKPYRNQSSNGYLAGNLKNTRHFYIMGGYNWQLNEDVTIIPNGFWDYVKNNPFHIQGGITGRYKDVLDVGVAYSYKDALILLAKVDFLKGWSLGYSYDLSIAKLRGYNNGSHEIMIGYTFKQKKKEEKVKAKFE